MKLPPQFTLAQLKTLTADRTFVRLAARCLMLEALHGTLKAKVWHYLRPISTEFDFRFGATMSPGQAGQPITNPDDLYLCDNDAGCAAYYAACDRAHRRAGFDLPAGYSPVLVAENELIRTQRRLLARFDDHMGCPDTFADTFGDHRKQALKLVLGAALQNPLTARWGQLMLPRNPNRLLQLAARNP